MLMLVDCSNCHTPLQLPPGARSIRCSICQAITNVADPRSLPPPPPQHATSSNYYPPQHPPHVPVPFDHVYGQVPGVNGRKKAVICGISYKGSKLELKGCINDAKCMKHLLINKFKFPESSIVMLTARRLEWT
ncbi:metacaspase 2 [Artemisia annua]|uniref:Metacaspase 2 n=1 Tax=Artemisia annua TaxID=35608 RepID=A0A2U1KMI7_ARTAN|nr:metacaspase 2 [Artemisia annua]